MPAESIIRARTPDTVPTVRELAIVLFRRRKVFAWVTIAALAVSFLYAAFGTNYEASMKILVRRGRAEAPVSAAENAPLDLTRIAVTEEELNSEVELLRDRDVLRKVIEETGAGGRDWFHFMRLREVSAARLERATRRLAKKVTVEPVKKTNLIEIRYKASDPESAEKVLQSLAKAYVEKHTSVHRPAGESGFFQQQMNEARAELERAQEELLRFSESNGSVSAGLQRDLALQKLSEIDAGQRQTGIDLAEAQTRIAALRSLLTELPERATTQVRNADNPELMKALKASLLDLQLRRTQLLTKFEPTHRLVQEVDHQIDQAKTAIEHESLHPLRDETSDQNAHFEWAKSELEKYSVQASALQARQAAASRQTIAYQDVARKLGADAITQEHLLGNEKVALDNYLLYVKKQEESRLNDALDERGIVNVAVAEWPVVPALPVVSVPMVLALGFLGAGAAGVSAAFVADYIDPAFRDAEDVRAYLNAPVLASLPRSARGRILS
ncbi:MAG TPA: Wzz/FepE/Etk N-terminal domain-containing protein [Candidatus Eisenbacteria bacterium]|nr:Wzz/FepE/Etk N-terminal domain-containing protein [Candidatus Eisenbacteria bacterium]